MRKKKKAAKKDIWKKAAFVLSAFLIISIITGGFRFGDLLSKSISALENEKNKNFPDETNRELNNAIARLQDAKKIIKGTYYINDILVEEFSEFDCSRCIDAFRIMKNLRKDYSGKISFAYRHFPTSQKSMKAAEAAECARDQLRFWEMHDKLYANMALLETTDLKRYADDLSLNITSFGSCLDSGIKDSIVKKDHDEGIRRHVGDTPAFFINGEKIKSNTTYGNIAAEIDKLLK